TVSDMRGYLKSAVAAVAPMRMARGVQNKILEALAMGTPVVSSRTAAAALPAELTLLLQVADEPQQWSNALVRCSQEILAERQTRRRSLVQYMDGQNLSAELESIVQGAVDRTSKTKVHATESDLTPLEECAS